MKRLAVVPFLILALAACQTPRPVVSTRTREADDMVMVYVPGGTFQMGSDTGVDNEKPVHEVTLDSFWIDQMEVTNAQYAHCVADGKCSAPPESRSSTRDSYYGDSQYADYPVLYVSWDDASTYCAWAGAQLPTEARWEYAARGPDGHKYPWGDESPSEQLLNYNSNVGDTSPVGSYPAGASWAGTLDMAGNVWEWVGDWYGTYPSEKQANPTGPTTGDSRVLRGGSWGIGELGVPATHRSYSTPDNRDQAFGAVGFRCVVAAPGG